LLSAELKDRTNTNSIHGHAMYIMFKCNNLAWRGLLSCLVGSQIYSCYHTSVTAKELLLPHAAAVISFLLSRTAVVKIVVATALLLRGLDILFDPT
jgi:hypothetical protein